MAKLDGYNELVVRKYKQLSASKNAVEFELVALSDDWADVIVQDDNKSGVVATVLFLNRFLKR